MLSAHTCRITPLAASISNVSLRQARWGVQCDMTQQRGLVSIGASVSQAKGHTLFSMETFGRVRLLGKLLGEGGKKVGNGGQIRIRV